MNEGPRSQPLAAPQTQIVLDVGCAEIGTEESVRKLVARFHPSLLLGFDPQVEQSGFHIDGTEVRLLSLAAWTRGGTVPFVRNATRSHVAEEDGGDVECFDLPLLLRCLPGHGVLKLDIEGGEYELLPRIHECGADERLDLILVEWHGDPLDLPLRCPVEEW